MPFVRIMVGQKSSPQKKAKPPPSSDLGHQVSGNMVSTFPLQSSIALAKLLWFFQNAYFCRVSWQEEPREAKADANVLWSETPCQNTLAENAPFSDFGRFGHTKLPTCKRIWPAGRHAHFTIQTVGIDQPVSKGTLRTNGGDNLWSIKLYQYGGNLSNL